MFHLWRCKGGTTRVLESANRNSFLCIPSQHAHRHAHVYVCADFDTRFWLWLEIQQMTLQDFEHNDKVCFEKKNWDLMMIMIPLKKDQEHWLIFINIAALGYSSKFGILSKRSTSGTVFVKYKSLYGLFATLLRSKNTVRFSIRYLTLLHSALLVVWPITMLKRSHFSRLLISRFPTP